MKLIATLTIILIILGFLENFLNNRNLKKIPIRILVNGTRGKTSVTKLLTATFQASGMSCMAKTTGSQALIIEKDGSVVPFVRKRGSRLTELIPFIRNCANQNVDCIIVECMALRLENQRILSNKILKPTHVLVTNTYVDHITEIGDSIEKTTYTLSQSVPKTSHLFVNEDFDLKYISKEVQVTKSLSLENIDNFSSNFTAFPENLYLVASVLNFFKIPLNVFETASFEVKLDIGMYQKLICRNGSIFYPSFSANDITSVSKILRNIDLKKYNSICFIFNNRLDREYRVKQFSKLLIDFKGFYKIFIIGENSKMVSKYFNKKNDNRAQIISNISILHEIMDESDDSTLYIGIGNIQGQGKALVQSFIEDKK